MLGMIACGAVLGRILGVASIDRLALETRLIADEVAKRAAAGTPIDPAIARKTIEREKRLIRPFLSANDRSRWLTLRSLVEQGTFAIDGIVVEPGWDTIDAVAHKDSKGTMRLYSSKPPLLSVLLAGPYWVIHQTTGWTLGDHPFEIGRMLMVLYGVFPLAIMICFTAMLVERIGTSDWGRIWSVALISLGTYLTTFSSVLTNHLPAAACTALSAWFVFRIRNDQVRRFSTFFMAGLFAGLAAALELPALAWTTLVAVGLGVIDPRRTLLATLPAFALIAMAAVGTNWLAHGTLTPAYAHRNEPNDNWYRYSITLTNGKTLESYWTNPKGTDRGEPSQGLYAVHSLVGHHGIFSLTPAWLLLIPGLVMLSRSCDREHRRAATAIALVSLVVIAFYLSRGQPDRNYGGMTSAFRWVFWLAPLWVAAIVPVADKLSGCNRGRALGLLLLGSSVMSAAYPSWNPWVHPWLYHFMVHIGLVMPV
ncbi:MAG: hypothetical protein DWH80_07140 [Planctomycetota bacterium]|nr:MAG: hypothetical protein DWH80_07140 [Planctomycetota bacterium]